MAYITTETVRNIRNNLKKEFPNIKFSIRKRDFSKVNVTILKSPYFEDGVYKNYYHFTSHCTFDNEEQKQVIKRIDEIIRETGNWFDESDSQVDYFHTAFYYGISVGAWDKKHIKV